MKLRRFTLRLIATFLALSFSAVNAAPPDEGLNILFIGNSFSARHNLPNLVKVIAAEGQPHRPISSSSVGYGGRDLFRHYELYRSQDLLCIESLTDADFTANIERMRALAKPGADSSFYTEYWKKVDSAPLEPFEEYEAEAAGRKRYRPQGRWEEDQKLIVSTAIRSQEFRMRNRKHYPTPWTYVALQSWHDISPDPEIGYQKYATLFAELAKRQNTKPILYITAPYSQNATPVTEPVEAERVLRETRIVAGLAKKLDALVVPVPLAIYRLQKSGAPFTFRYQKDGHPNQVCGYLTACLFYAAIFDKSPEGLPLSEVVETTISDKTQPDLDPDGNPRKRVFTDEERTLLQKTAWETIQAFRSGQF